MSWEEEQRLWQENCLRCDRQYRKDADEAARLWYAGQEAEAAAWRAGLRRAATRGHLWVLAGTLAFSVLFGSLLGVLAALVRR